MAALDRQEPHIKPAALQAITVPTLVLASDHDAIADEHTLEIYHHLSKAQLVIFPGATYDPSRRPGVVQHDGRPFLPTPFVETERVADLVKSFARMRAEYVKDHATQKK